MLDEREPGSLSLGALVERGPAESRLSLSSFEEVMLNPGATLADGVRLVFERLTPKNFFELEERISKISKFHFQGPPTT